MKCIFISLEQLFQLQRCAKHFTVVFFPTWRVKRLEVYLKLLAQVTESFESDLVVFLVYVSTSSEAEEFVIHSLNCSSLPVLYVFDDQFKQLDLLQRNTLDQYSSHLSREIICKFDPTIDYITTLLCFKNGNENEEAVGSLFISGDRSSVGKSSIAAALLATLINRGVSPDALAYIKPVTQCELVQPVTAYCNKIGIAERSIGPVVFYSGFTRSYLSGETSTTEEMLEDVQTAVKAISIGKVFTLIDGVGYPSVGSICNISNADVAYALGCPVLLVGKSGVGDAVDSYNLNAVFFEHKNVKVLGGIFNKIPISGFYGLDQCKAAVCSYFQQFRENQVPYGFLPLITVSETISVSDSSNNLQHSENDLFLRQIIAAFENNIDINRLIHDAWIFQIFKKSYDVVEPSINAQSKTPQSLQCSYEASCHQLPSQHLYLNGNSDYFSRRASSQPQTRIPMESVSRKRFRAEIESAAQSIGAAIGS